MTTTEKNKLITDALATRIKSGMTARQAWEDLFGAGSWEKFAGQIYDALQEQA